MRTQALSITAASVVKRPAKNSLISTTAKIRAELQTADSPMHSQRTRLHRGRQSVLFIPVDQIRRKNVCSDRKSRRDRDDERDDLSIRPDGRERVRAAEISGDSGIRRVEELLHDTAQRDGKCEL